MFKQNEATQDRNLLNGFTNSLLLLLLAHATYDVILEDGTVVAVCHVIADDENGQDHDMFVSVDGKYYWYQSGHNITSSQFDIAGYVY